MLDFTFYTYDKNTSSYNISEQTYKYLANAGFDKITKVISVSLTIEDEIYEDIAVIKLNDENREKFKRFIENERHLELKKIFSEISETPTIKEIRSSFGYVKELTELFDLFNNENYEFFLPDY